MWVICELLKEVILKNGKRSGPVYVEKMERVKFIVF